MNVVTRFARRLSMPIFRTTFQASKSLSNSTKFEDGNGNEWNNTNKFQKTIIGAFTFGIFTIYLNERYKIHCEHPGKDKDQEKAGELKEGLPTYTFEEISKHNTVGRRVWVTYKEGVYDITDFIEGHPGGDQILLAAGSSVEPFWMLYSIHKNPHVYDILEGYRIGNVNKEETRHLVKDLSDPYSTDPLRHIALKPASVKPFNAELPPSLLVESFITPNELFYVRNHLPVPKIDPQQYKLEVEVEGSRKKLTLSLEDLKKLPKYTFTATLMCAGNRRSEMVKVKPVKGLNWGPAAVGNAQWTGVLLRDILKMAGFDENDDKYKHVQFEGDDTDVTGSHYGASIPIWKAMDKRGDVLLAYEMNGQPLPEDHGFPVRVIVPGVCGARNVKWLARIVVSEHESSSHWQQNDYKSFAPNVNWENADFCNAPAVQDMPVTSAICKPYDGDTVRVVDGKVHVKGYAWSGGGQKILRVDVTADGGKTWHVANLQNQDAAEPPRHWAWTLWSAQIPVDKKAKTAEIWVKAVDSCNNTQPEHFEHIWNLRGILSNAYHKVAVKLEQ